MPALKRRPPQAPASPDLTELTELLAAWQGGDEAALNELMARVAQELKWLARSYLAQERPEHTLEPTALVNELYLRLVRGGNVRIRSRAHFFAAAATTMRRILVDHARRRKAGKRGGGVATAPLGPLGEGTGAARRQAVDLLALDEALTRLHAIEPRQRRVVELRFFAGLSIDETAEVLGLAPRTVKQDWTQARAWLFHTLAGG
jgi:RNA polymerase sigma factor (TIGR02999 family)